LGSAGSSIDIQCSTPHAASATNARERATATGRTVAPVAVRMVGLTGAESWVATVSSERDRAGDEAGGGVSVALTGAPHPASSLEFLA
jgi:hypothetical protein